jgi:hypothetical protein
MPGAYLIIKSSQKIKLNIVRFGIKNQTFLFYNVQT